MDQWTPQFVDLVAAVESGFPVDRARTPDHVRQFWSIRNDLLVENGIVLYGTRIFLPMAFCQDILKKLHVGHHQGIVRTKMCAQQTIYWPGITNDVTMLIQRCASCQERLTCHCQKPTMSDPLLTYVFQDVFADLFQHGSLHVLVYADRLSGWSVVHQWRREPTTREVVQAAVSNFFELGVPMRFRSDDGPQFNAGIFQDTLWR